MLHVSIKDTKTNEVIYDEEVSMLIMLATEKDSIRTIRHTTEDADITEIMCLTKALTKEAKEAKVLLQVIEQELGLTDVDNDK